MSFVKVTPVFAILALAACGDDQTAQAPATPGTPAPPVVVAEPAPPPATPAPPAVATAPVPATPPGDISAAAPELPRPAETTGAVTAPGAAGPLQPFIGRAYTAGPVGVQFNPDGTFVMNEVEGNRRVQGRYALQDGVLTLSDPEGDVGGATFPMRCRFEPVGGEFRLAELEGACTRFRDLTFRAG